MPTSKEKTKLENTHKILVGTVQELENMEFKARDAGHVFEALDFLRKAEDRIELLLLRFD